MNYTSFVSRAIIVSGMVLCGANTFALTTITSKASLDTYLKDNTVVVLKVGIPGCEPCRQMEPELSKMEKEFPEAIFLGLEGGKYESFATSLGARAFPTVIIFKDGKQVKKTVGYTKGKVADIKKTIQGCTK